MIRFKIVRKISSGEIVPVKPLLPFDNLDEALNHAQGMNFPQILTDTYGYRYVVIIEWVRPVEMRNDYKQMGLL